MSHFCYILYEREGVIIDTIALLNLDQEFRG